MAEIKKLQISRELLDQINGKWIPIQGVKVTELDDGFVDIQFTEDVELMSLLDKKPDEQV